MSNELRTNNANQPVVGGILCKKCSTVIWSRHRHDFHSCSCGAVYIDGGRDYLRIVGRSEDWEHVDVEVGEPCTQPTVSM